MSVTPWQHTTVLLHEAIEALMTNPSGTYVDGTFGRGGHSRLLLQRLAPEGRLIAIDRDPEAVAAASSGPTRIEDPRFTIHHANFTEASQVLDSIDQMAQTYQTQITTQREHFGPFVALIAIGGVVAVHPILGEIDRIHASG